MMWDASFCPFLLANVNRNLLLYEMDTTYPKWSSNTYWETHSLCIFNYICTFRFSQMIVILSHNIIIVFISRLVCASLRCLFAVDDNRSSHTVKATFVACQFWLRCVFVGVLRLVSIIKHNSFMIDNSSGFLEYICL